MLLRSGGKRLLKPERNLELTSSQSSKPAILLACSSASFVRMDQKLNAWAMILAAVLKNCHC